MIRLALSFALVATACSQQKGPDVDANVVATVDGRPISRADFERELSSEAQAMEGPGTRTPEQMEPYKRALLDTMVERAVLMRAAADAGVAVTSEEVDGRMLALASEYPAGSFDEALANGKTSKSDLERRTREQLAIEKLLQAQVFSRVAITEAQLRADYDANTEAYAEPEKVRALQIVVQGLDEAKRLQQQLAQGKKFQELARRYSLSPDAKVGGDLGFFSKGKMPPAFDEVVFKLAVNQVSDVVTTDYGFHLFKVIEKKPARKRELTEVRDAIEKRLVARLSSERQQAYLAELKSKAVVKVNEQVLVTISAKPAPGAPSKSAIEGQP